MTIPPALAFLALLVAVAIAPFAVSATLQVLLGTGLTEGSRPRRERGRRGAIRGGIAPRATP